MANWDVRRVNTGTLLYGWQTYATDYESGTVYWLDGNFWRIWNERANAWIWTSYRDHARHGNTWAAYIMAFIVVLMTTFVSSHQTSGGSSIVPAGAALAGFIILLGHANSWLQNNRPRAYQTLAIGVAAVAAYDLLTSEGVTSQPWTGTSLRRGVIGPFTPVQ